MKSTRERILQTLLENPRTPIPNLAEAVGINPISVRHHLSSLENDGLVDWEEERHGVGRPRLVYFLTEAGQEHFPTRYFRLTNQLLEELKKTLPEETVRKIFLNMANTLSSEHSKRANSVPLEERLNILQEFLTAEGFVIEWDKDDENYYIREITCPYYHVGQSHPEVCTLDQTIISNILNIPARKVNCILQGDQHCSFVIPHKDLEASNE
ncbi:MAG: winged helix-turn-helix transcriptional regulator [bacterium]